MAKKDVVNPLDAYEAEREACQAEFGLTPEEKVRAYAIVDLALDELERRANLGRTIALVRLLDKPALYYS